MDLQLEGHTVVVAGGARGIGLAIAREFAAEKANVALLDREAEVAGVAESLGKEYSVRAVGKVVDVTEGKVVRRAAEEVEEMFGTVEHLVYAVGIGSGKYGFPFWNVEPEDWDRVLRVNVVGAVQVAHAFVPALIRRKTGTVLFLASVAGQMGSQTDPPYSASKAALINFSQCAAKDLAPHGIRVNCLCPGMIKTALNRSVWEAWARQQPKCSRDSYEEWAGEKVRRVVPLGRWQEPEDVAAMAVFLASERGKNVAGQTINVDGGFVMHW